MNEKPTAHQYEYLISKIQHDVGMSMSMELVQQAEVDIKIANFISNSVVILVRTHVHGIEDEMIIIDEEYPENWWEHFRERWFPKWALKKWPIWYKIKYKQERRFKRVCPHLQKENQGKHLRWLATGDSDE